METGVTAGWTDFAIAAGGAAGALAGLVFVALSINLERILKLPGVPGRAAETMMLLGGTLVAALVALVPHQTPFSLGLLFLAVGLPTWGLPTWIQIRELRARNIYHVRYTVQRLIFQQTATLPFLLAGASLLGYLRGGLYWFAAALILSMVVALINAWVLLVEILR
jgi:hypothetical protein